MRAAAFLQWVLLLMALHAPGGFAQTFREAVQLARDSEPVYLGIKANAAAAQQRSKQAFAGLLPQVNATASTHANRRNYYTRGGGTSDQIDRYNNNTAQLSLTQPLYRPSNVSALRQADSAVSQAAYQLLAAEQELLAKLLVSWLDTMSSRDNVLFTTRQAAAASQQWDILRRGVDLGTASAPAAEEARAKQEQALAEKTSAEMEFQVKTAALEQIIGPVRSFAPPYLANSAGTQDLGTESLDAWLGRLERSPQVLAAAQALNAADEEIRKQRSLHEPTLDLVGSYGNNSQQVGNFPGQNGYDIRTGALGLQLNVPLFAGGGQMAKVSEAIALREKARQELEAVHRSGRLAAKQAWFGWFAANARYGAALQTVRASLIALRAATVGIESGVKTDLDRLLAVAQLEAARRDINKARYDLIASFVRLKAVFGQLSDDDVSRIERMFMEREADLQEIVALK